MNLLRRVLRPLRESLAAWREIRRWELAGRPIPAPPAVKHRIVLEYARRFGLRAFVETGTFRGDMIRAVRSAFRRVDSIELDPDLHEKARERFRNDARIRLHAGDSAAVLPRILADLKEPALFWLDAHFSGAGTARGNGNTPVRTELDLILLHPQPGHVVLVDDARLFTGADDYPSVDECRRQVGRARGGWTLDVRDDVIRIHRAPGATG